VPHYYFHLCLGSHVIAHDMVGRECENNDAARQHARTGGGLASLDPLMPSPFSRYDLTVVNEAGEKVFLFPLSTPLVDNPRPILPHGPIGSASQE
jgi:hypothetical protein